MHFRSDRGNFIVMITFVMATLLPRQSIILCIVLKQIGTLLFDYLVSKQRSIRLIFCPIIIAFDYKPNYYQP